MTTINKLIDHLTKCIEDDPRNGDLPVFLARDADGSDFRPTDGDFDIVSGEDIDREDLWLAAVLWPAW